MIADFQVGMWLANIDTIRRIVAQLVEERPSLVLIAGDVTNGPPRNQVPGSVLLSI